MFTSMYSCFVGDFFYLFIFIYLFFWLRWVFASVRGLSLVAASGGHSSSRCAGLSLSWPLLLRSTGSRRAGSVVVAHRPSCSSACGILPDQGPNPCPPHWQADSQPLCHQGSPLLGIFVCFLKISFIIFKLRFKLLFCLWWNLISAISFANGFCILGQKKWKNWLECLKT